MGEQTTKTNSGLSKNPKITEFGKSKFHFAISKLPEKQRLFLNQFVQYLRAGDSAALESLLINYREFHSTKFPYQGRQMTPDQIIYYEKNHKDDAIRGLITQMSL